MLNKNNEKAMYYCINAKLQEILNTCFRSHKKNIRRQYFDWSIRMANSARRVYQKKTKRNKINVPL